MEKIRFGANYIPSKNWLHCWINWDPVSVEEDLIAAKELGVDHIRAHLLWPYFQLDAGVMNTKALEHLEEFRGICEKVKMDYCLALLDGFMSGLFFWPGFISRRIPTPRGGVELYTDEYIVKAQEFYLRNVAAIVADSPQFIGFDLGNELSCTFGPAVTTPEDIKNCDAWAQKMLNLCEELAPNKLHNNGVDHQPWFIHRGFSRKNLANTGSITPLHTYIRFTEALGKFGRMSTESLHLAPFMSELARAYSDDLNRPLWIQEFGTASDVWDDEMAEFVEKSIHNMYTTENLWGITWWCTNNIANNYSSYDKIEYSLGLLDVNNKPMPAGNLFKKIVDDYNKNPVAPVKRSSAMVLKLQDEECRDYRTLVDLQWENGRKYAEYVNQGIYPAIILPEKVNDTAYLKARGITEILK